MTAERRWRALMLAPLFVAACSDAVVDPPIADAGRPHDIRIFSAEPAQAAFDALPGATAYHGVHEGIHGQATYRIEVPDTWNDVLVMYAHGYRGTAPELVVSSPPGGLRAHLVASGYAWAASSFSANYYDVRSGVEDTNALAAAFPQLTGRPAPSKYYVIGESMGGHVAGAAVEAETLARARNPMTYAAALPMCGVMADNELSNYYYAVGIAARELAGMPVTSFPIADLQATLPAVKQALWTSYPNPDDLPPEGERFRNALMHLSGGARPGFDQMYTIYMDLLFDRAGGNGTWSGILGDASANTAQIVYQLDGDPAQSAEEAAFNAAIFRVQGDFEQNNPARSDGVRAIPVLEGRFDVPVLTLHTLETRVPLSMQQIYAERAAANGSTALLVQRVVRSHLHCDFTTEELVAAFDALVAWEAGGSVPAGDDLLDPAEVSDPEFGCAFTSATRPGIAACP